MVTKGKKSMLVSAIKSGSPEVQVNQLLASSASWHCQGESFCVCLCWVYNLRMKDCMVMMLQGEVVSESGTL